MRGQDSRSGSLFSDVDLEQRVRLDHPLRTIRTLVNRNGLIVDGCVTEASGQAERTAALAMIEKRADRPNCITLGADKGYDAADFVNEPRSMNVTAHVARNTAGRRSAVDGRATRHAGYGVSQRIRKRIEEGWLGQGVRPPAPHPDARPRAGRHGFRVFGRGLQLHTPARAAR